MCFYHGDCDWSASVVETDEGPATKRTQCDECREWIEPGQWVRHIHQQEHERCQTCEDDSDYNRFNFDPDNEDCKAGKHDYGKTFDYDCCERCARLLAAIEAVEEAEGCVGEETRPMLCWMYEQVGDSDDGWRGYADKHAAIRPGVFVPWPFDLSEYLEQLSDEYDGFWCERHGDAVPEFAMLGGEA